MNNHSVQVIGPPRPITLQTLIAFLPKGIYLFNKSTVYPFTQHYVVVIKGHEFLKHFDIYDDQPRVIHKTNIGIHIDQPKTYGAWEGTWNLIGRVIPSESANAIWRMQISLMYPTNYDLFLNNCEHFARFVTEGYKQSTQVQNFGWGAAIGIGFVLLSNWGDREQRHGNNRIR
ncbi:MAG TPA: hypothetical protein VGO50_21155 [Pyrinomonadaceae bacterium]|jgi:hypothetical protein|nr:hypothetical protein [Pyrinomonadaceae bacterium]